MCIMCIASRWSRRIVTMLPCVVIPLLILWALSQALPPGLRFEVTSPRLACVFVLLVILGWYEVVLPRLLQWRAKRTALLRDRRRIEAQEAARWRKEATRRCRNCLTAYRDQAPAGGRFMCTYCGHISRRPVLDIPGIASGLVNSGVSPSGGILLKGGITQIGIPVGSLYGGKNVRTWNGKGWTGKEWAGSDSWLRGCVGTHNCLGSNVNIVGDVFAAGENCSCSACESPHPRFIIFFLRIVGLFIFCMRWVWRRVFRRGSYVGDDEALTSVLKGRKSEEGCNAQETRGEKARRKAEEKRQARLEKEMREEEERKQREEVARLVEEQRRLRDEKLKAERESEREAEIKREREIKREKEVDRRRQEKEKQEKQVAKDKVQSDVKEAKKKAQENEKSGENGKREVVKSTTFHIKDRKGTKNFRVYNTDAGLRSNEQGMKGGCNNVFKACSSRNIVPLKGSFQSPPKTSAWQASNVMPLFGKSSALHSNVGLKSNKPTDSGDVGVGLLSDGNSSSGCNAFTPSTGFAWNRTDWGKSFGEGSDRINENFSRQEINSPNRNGEKNYSALEAQNPAASYACESPRIKQLQPPVGFQRQSLSPVSKKTISLDPSLISFSTPCSAATSAVLGISPKQEQIEVGNISVPISEEPMFPPRTTASLSSISVPVYTLQHLNSDNTVLPRDSKSPDKSKPREVSPLQEHISAQSPVFWNVPVPESLKSSSLDLKTNVISDTQTVGVSSPVSAPICVPIQRPTPIELPISKLLPSDIVDEVDAPGDQFSPIPEPPCLQSLSLDCSNGAFEEFKWQMWNTPQLGQINVSNRVEPYQQPVVNGMYEPEKHFLSPSSERTLFSPFEPDTHLPSCLFSPQKKPNKLNQSNGNHMVGVSGSINDSLWLNQPVYDSAEGSWNVPDHCKVQPSFSNGSTSGEMQDSVITTDCFPNDRISTGFWLKSGIDGENKSKWSADTASNSSCWSTTIKASTRPHVGGIYAPSHVQSLWSYK